MKIFVMILVATTAALAKSEITPKSGSDEDNVPQNFYLQPQQQQQIFRQSQYAAPNAISNSFFKPSSQYLPQPQSSNQNYALSPKQQLQEQKTAQLPMPSDFPRTLNLQPAVKSNRRYRPRARIPKKPIVTKNFYIHSAPEESDADIEEELAAMSGQPRKHYNVLFVKAPSQTNIAAALNMARNLKEEKTVVYVLAKRTSAADLQDAVQDGPQQIAKPEVFFIKYRTPEEAANAQRQIQSQYESLGGSTTINDEGIAPATSVIGSLDASEEEDEEEPQQSIENPQIQTSSSYDELQVENTLTSSPGSNEYLPPPNRY